MRPIIIALLFVFALVTQSGSLSVDQDGIRPPAVAVQPSRLTEYADCDDAGHNFIIATIVPATPALERVLPLPFVQSLNRTQPFDRDSVPLHELHAVWRI
jgi:hypothetical protein